MFLSRILLTVKTMALFDVAESFDDAVGFLASLLCVWADMQLEIKLVYCSVTHDRERRIRGGSVVR